MPTSSPQHLAIAGLYAALMTRAPDADGFTFWTQAVTNGASMRALAQTFLGTPEGLANYPVGQTAEQFLIRFYTSVFGRAPDAGGLAFWTAALSTQGGAESTVARAALVTQIVNIVSTPLAAKPDGLSDLAYAQTVSDRARFANKSEFGVYFATELRSNDITKAKAALEIITDSPASLAAARDYLITPEIPPVPPVPTLAISRADSPIDITSKFAAYPGTTATVDAAGMNAAQQAAVAVAAPTKVAAGGIDNLSLVLGDALITDTVTAALLAKATNATVDASGATTNEVTALVDWLTHVAPNGISGTLSVHSGIAAADITRLFAKYAGTTARIDAAGMSDAQLVAVAQVDAKIAAGSIAGLSLALGATGITDAISATLLAKATGAKVDASNATSVEIAALVTALANVAANGIVGALVLDRNTAAADIGGLMSKYAGTTATVDAAGMSPAQQAAVAAAAFKVSAGGIGNLSLVLDDALITNTVTGALLAKATDATVDASGATTNEVAALASSLAGLAANGISGALPVASNLGAADIATLFAKYAGTTARVDASDMNGAQLAAVAGVISKIAADGIAGALSLDHTIAAADITSLLAKYSGATALVNAYGMDTAQLQAVAAASAKLATNGIANLALNQSTLALADTQAAALLAKAAGASFDATGAAPSRLQLVANHIGHVADNGITGSATLTSAMTAAQLAALLGPKMAVAATVQVDASSMSMDQLAVVGANPGKLDSLSKLPTLDLGNASITSSIATELLSHGMQARVLTTGASTANIDVLLAALPKIAASGISGVLPLNAAQFAATSAAALDPKLAAGATLSVTGTGGDDTFDISAYVHGVKVDGGAGQETLVVTGNTVLGAGAGAANFTGIETLLLKGAATAYLSKIPGLEKVSLDASTGKIEVREVTRVQAQNLKILGGDGSAVSLYLDGAAANAADFVKATVSTTNISGNAQAINLTGITLPDVERLELSGNGGGASGMLTLTTANAKALTTIKVSNTGGATITVDAGHTGTGLVIGTRGSGSTTIDASAYVPASGVRLFAGDNGGRLVGSAHADTITGGAGDDIIVGDGVYIGSKGVAEVQTLTLSGRVDSLWSLYTLGGLQRVAPYGFSALEWAKQLMGYEYNINAIKSGGPIADISVAYGDVPVFTVTYLPSAGDVAPLRHAYTGTGLITGAALEVVKGVRPVDFLGTVAAASADTLTGGGGKNTFVFARNSSTVDAFDTITDIDFGSSTAGGMIDKLLLQTTATTASVGILTASQQVQVREADTLAESVNLVLSFAPAAGTLVWVIVGASDQYLVFNGDGNTSFDNTADYVSKLQGITGLLDASDIMLVA